MKKTFQFLFFSTLIMILMVIFSKEARAEEIQSTNNRVTVVPAKFELWGKPGGTIQQTLKVTNEDSEDAIIALSVQGFGITGENGEVTLNESYSGNPGQIVKWITFDQKSSEFKPKETKIINFKIEIPEEVRPGGQYASIVVGMDRINRKIKESGASAKVVSLLMLDIAGNVQEKTGILSFKALRTSGGSYDFVLRASNSGNSHIKPKGMIVITNLWGTKVDEFPLNGENILPGLTRKMTTSWQPKKSLAGFYTATLVSNYGIKADQQLNTATAFFVLSRPILAVILFLTLVTSAIISNFLLKRRKLDLSRLKIWKKG